MEIKVEHHIGDTPEGMITDWWTEQDWNDWNSYIEECKRNGTFGNPVTSTLILKDDPLFDNMNECKFILDLDSIEIFEIKPLK